MSGKNRTENAIPGRPGGSDTKQEPPGYGLAPVKVQVMLVLLFHKAHRRRYPGAVGDRHGVDTGLQAVQW